MKWAIHEVDPVPFSVARNVALVGDAVGYNRYNVYRALLRQFS